MGLNRKIIGYLFAVLFLVSACEKKAFIKEIMKKTDKKTVSSIIL